LAETATNTATATATRGPDAAEQSIDTLIDGRARLEGNPDWHAEQWDESVRAYHMGVEAQRREQWARWHRQQAQRHRRTLEDLIAHHEQQAEALGGGARTGWAWR
jgi:hypothetical protein